MTTNLILTGFMGTGKTTVGKLVAERLGRQFVDTDSLIEQRAGLTIPQIFEQHGEAFFRAYEAQLADEFAEPGNRVIATGGGMLVFNHNLERIARKGSVVIRLSSSIQNVIQRLEDATDRPLYKQPDNPREAIEKLFHKRRNNYEKIRLIVDTTDRTPEDIAYEVIEVFEREVERNAYRLRVTSPTNQYDILCHAGLLDEVPTLLKNYRLNGRVAVITNQTLAPIYGEKLANCLPDAALITIPDGEVYKSLDTVHQIYEDLIAAGISRSGVIIALGGGVVGDTAGYAAATYLRGLPLVQIPTSLLAMVDSSVGGKVGVDVPQGKNLVGAFKQPELVIIDSDVLKSLPDVEIRSGMAEAIKHALLADPDLLNEVYRLREGDADVLRRTVQVKIDVVERDPYEHGERAHLNLGHTFGHAIEQVSGYRWRHGEAVGVGLLAAAKLAYALDKLPLETVQHIESLLNEVQLPTRINGFNAQDLWEAMKTDKKWRGGQSHFIILEAIGKPAIITDVPEQTVITVLEEMKG
jgi:3-dehydroquinate synthase